MTIDKYKLISEDDISREIYRSYCNNEGNIYSDIEEKYGDSLTRDEIIEKMLVMEDAEIMNKAVLVLLDILHKETDIDVCQAIVDRFVPKDDYYDMNECIICDLLDDRLAYIESFSEGEM